MVHWEQGVITIHSLYLLALAFLAVTLTIGILKRIMQVSWDHPSILCVTTMLTMHNFINFCSFRPSQPVLSSTVSFSSRGLKRFADRDLFNCEIISLDLLSTDFFYEHNSTVGILGTLFKCVQ